MSTFKIGDMVDYKWDLCVEAGSGPYRVTLVDIDGMIGFKYNNSDIESCGHHPTQFKLAKPKRSNYPTEDI